MRVRTKVQWCGQTCCGRRLKKAICRVVETQGNHIRIDTCMHTYTLSSTNQRLLVVTCHPIHDTSTSRAANQVKLYEFLLTFSLQASCHTVDWQNAARFLTCNRTTPDGTPERKLIKVHDRNAIRTEFLREAYE